MSNGNPYIKYYNANRKMVEEFSNPDSEYVFILESPHNDEVESGYVACGRSGKSMAKVLGISQDKSLGELLKTTNRKDISVLNISCAPLQKVKSKKIRVKDRVIKDIQRVREKDFKNKEEYLKKRWHIQLKEFEKFILQDFTKRMSPLINTPEKKTIIVCGNFAKAYFKAFLEETPLSFKKVLYVPHPSRNQWGNYINWKEGMESMLELFPKENNQ